jgi:hypothetical protein
LSPVVMLMVRQESARIGSQVKSSQVTPRIAYVIETLTPGRWCFSRRGLDACADSLHHLFTHGRIAENVGKQKAVHT